MKKYFGDLKYVLPLYILLLITFTLTWAHQGHIIIDSGREIYYPERILNGSILYKDLFNIYGPFSYLYNALLFKVFSVKLSTIYLSGIITATAIITMIYLLSRLFFEKLMSFSITILSIVIGCFSFYIFNYIFPYSYGMTYGLLACLISLYFLIFFLRNNQSQNFYLSTFFAGIAISNKYEFLPYCLIFIFLAFKNKLSLKINITAFITFIIMPVLCFGILFYQGLTITDLYHNFKDIYNMTQTATLRFFYIISGLIFQKPTLGILIRNFIKDLIPISLIFCGIHYFSKYKIKATIALLLGIFFTFKGLSVETFIFLPLLLIILACICCKNKTEEINIFSITALLMSLKVFWATTLNSYGLFFIPILIIALINYAKKEWHKTIIIYLLCLTLGFAFLNYKERTYKKIPITSNRGIIYEHSEYKTTAQELVNYILNNTKQEDKILILPEGLFFNFLTNRKSDDYYNSYLPLYIETFGENRLINSIKKNNPQYIFIHNFPTSNYYFKSICKDYGFEICEYINSEYRPKNLLLKDFTVYVFEKK